MYVLSQSDSDQKRLVFRVEDQRHEIDARLVLEVLKVPHITRVPHGPEALAGIVNLRGRPVPVLSMSQILHGRKNPPGPDGKIILYDHHGPLGLLVDDVLRLSSETAALPLHDLTERLDTAFKVAARAPVDRTRTSNVVGEGPTTLKLTTLLSFRVAGQLYGLPLDQIREVTKLPGDVSVLPNATDAVMGVIPFRHRSLPIVSLASLLGLGASQTGERTSNVIVVEHDSRQLGLAVDGLDAIRRIPGDRIDAVPAVLQRGKGEAQVEAIGRVADGDLLISILSPAKLYAHHAVAGAIGETSGDTIMDDMSGDEARKVEQFLIFQLGDESYGLPIGAVDEVVRVPEEITRIPKAPSYVLGVMNLRGRAIPLIDQRTRFDTPLQAASKGSRAIVLKLGELRAGFIVDSVTEVTALSQDDLSTAPEFASDQTDVFDRIAHIAADGRMILLIDPKELLSRAERDVLSALTTDKTTVANT